MTETKYTGVLITLIWFFEPIVFFQVQRIAKTGKLQNSIYIFTFTVISIICRLAKYWHWLILLHNTKTKWLVRVACNHIPLRLCCWNNTWIELGIEICLWAHLHHCINVHKWAELCIELCTLMHQWINATMHQCSHWQLDVRDKVLPTLTVSQLLEHLCTLSFTWEGKGWLGFELRTNCEVK